MFLFSLVRYYKGISNYLDSEFKTLNTLTDGQLNDTKTNTEPLRIAISRYAASCYGARDDM